MLGGGETGYGDGKSLPRLSSLIAVKLLAITRFPILLI